MMYINKTEIKKRRDKNNRSFFSSKRFKIKINNKTSTLHKIQKGRTGGGGGTHRSKRNKGSKTLSDTAHCIICCKRIGCCS